MPPALNHCAHADTEFSTPFMSFPAGGVPPAPTGRKVAGGKPADHDAAGVVAVSGIVFLLPVLAKGSGILAGRSVISMTPHIKTKDAATPVGFGRTPVWVRIAFSTSVKVNVKTYESVMSPLSAT